VSLARFGVKRPVVANLTMWVIIGAGLIFGLNLRREFFPEVRPTQVSIAAPYPGASPDEVERSLAKKIEDRIADLDGVKEMNTSVREGLCSILIEFEEGYPIDRALADVKREVDALEDLPAESDRILVDKFEPNLPAINLALYGDADERVMKEAIRQMREDLRTLPGMGDISVGGVRKDEITIEVDPATLLEHRLSLPGIADRVRQGLIELPSGSVRSSTTNVTVRTLGKDETVDEVRAIVVKSDGDQVLTIGDIARVTRGFEDIDVRQRLNGKPAVSLTAFKVGKEDAVEMADMVKAYVKGRLGQPIENTWWERVRLNLRRLATPPGGVESDTPVSRRMQAYRLGLASPAPPPGELTVTTDLARFIVGRLDLLSRNAMWGGLFVFLTLVLLLNIRVAFWVTLGVIIAVLGTLAVMHFAGITLNLLTMFGLIIVLGILVDDGIVIAENITTKHERGMNPIDAAIGGTEEVGWPVIGTVLTTVVAFLPLALLDGRIGDLIGVLPWVVVCALAMSMVEALFILPTHMAHSLATLDEKHEPGRAGWLQKLEFRADAARERFFQRVLIPAYASVLRLCLKHRYLTMSAVIAVTLFSVGMLAGGRLTFVFIDSSDSETVNVTLKMPTGTPIERTDEVARRIELAAMAQPEISAVVAQIGSVTALDGEGASQQPHQAQLIFELKAVEERDRSSEEVILAVRQAVGEIPGVKSLRMEEIGGGPEGPPISLTVTSDHASQIPPVVALLKERLGEFEGVYDIADDAEAGSRELRVELRDEAAPLGFTPEWLARQMRGAVFGLEAHTFAGDEEDVDVRVTLPREVRRDLAAVESLYVFAPDGRPVPLDEVARVTESTGYAGVQRLDRRRAVTVSAEFDNKATKRSVEEVVAALTPEIRRMELENPGVRVVSRGRQQDVADSFRTLPLGIAAAIGMIYVILAWLFGSYLQPFIILTAVPFSIVGVVWGHLMLGYDMTFLSLIGFIALSGVVVNDSIVFMEFFNTRRKDGEPIFNALVDTGRARLRAILLTTITTVLGLLPLISERSFQAKFLIPMAITISFGLMSATVLILVALPCMLMMLRDAKKGARRVWNYGLNPRLTRHRHAPTPLSTGTP